MDELGVFFKQSFETEPRMIEQARRARVEHEVRASDQLTELLAARFGVEIELNGPFVPVIRREAEAAVGPVGFLVAAIFVEEGAYAPGVAAPNWFDADHVSTEIPEHHPGQLTANVGEVEHSIGGK
jgi:hypothetical protein